MTQVILLYISTRILGLTHLFTGQFNTKDYGTFTDDNVKEINLIQVFKLKKGQYNKI